MSTRPVILLDGAASAPPEILGHKGHGIDMMRRYGLPVPPAFCIITGVGARYRAEPAAAIDEIWAAVLDGIRTLEAATSRTFGRGPHPLLVSVRSGAAVSMPGMMDTLLDLGFNDEVEKALTVEGSSDFARDSRRRFTESFASIVTGAVPDDPFAQLRAAIDAVFASWDSPRAVAYRSHHGLDDRGGTAVVVQAMVFGNLGANSGAGVVFSRNPMTGSNDPFGEWRPGSQGDDVVSGTVDVEPIATLPPALLDELVGAAQSLELLSGDVQEIEFTIQDGKLWLLQTRAAKRSAQAAVRLALQLLDDGLIDESETLRRVTPANVEALLKPSLQPETRLAAELLATGLPAGPGVASGVAHAEVDAAIDAADRGEDVILVRNHTSPDDIHGMLVARGVVTETGGATSHAAVVSRELGRVAVVGCGGGVVTSLAGKLVTVDGNAGEVRSGILPLSAWSEDDTPELRELAEIARRVSPLRAHSSGDYPRLDRPSEAAVRTALASGHRDVVSPQSPVGDAGGDPSLVMIELAVLQAVRLKGRISRDDLGADVDELIASGLLADGPLLRLTPEGRARLGELLDAERASVDPAVVAAAYTEFRSLNTEFKALVTDWQLRNGQPNTHDDADYDAAVLARLDTVHRQALPLVDAVAAELPRLASYSEKLEAALDRVHHGDTAWLSRPLIDSYHTVWFELHEELILAAGLTREAEDG